MTAGTQGALIVTSIVGTYGRTLTLTTSGGSGTGAVSYAVVNGTATGCTVTGASLTFTSPGTCIVTATKAGDTTYGAATSTPTTVTISKLPRPPVLTLGFAGTSHLLSAGEKHAIVALSRKLTVKSFVTITGYAPGNFAVAKSRAIAASNYLRSRINVHVTLHWLKNVALRAVKIATTAQ